MIRRMARHAPVSRTLILGGLTLAWLALAGPALAQLPTGGTPGWDASLTRLFGDIKAFQAKAGIQVLGTDAKPGMSLQDLGFCLLGEKVRMDIDMSRVSGPQIPAGALDSLRQMGMEKLVTVMLPDQKTVYFIYPALKVYVDKSLPAEESSVKVADIKIQKTKLADEALDGVACVKMKVVLSNAGAPTREAIVWEAAQLKGFPLKIQIVEDGKTLVISFRDVQLKAPDIKLFEPPAGFAKYDDFEKMAQVILQRMATSALNSGKK
jgi:hypothetical protein